MSTISSSYPLSQCRPLQKRTLWGQDRKQLVFFFFSFSVFFLFFFKGSCCVFCFLFFNFLSLKAVVVMFCIAASSSVIRWSSPPRGITRITRRHDSRTQTRLIRVHRHPSPALPPQPTSFGLVSHSTVVTLSSLLSHHLPPESQSESCANLYCHVTKKKKKKSV